MIEDVSYLIYYAYGMAAYIFIDSFIRGLFGIENDLKSILYSFVWVLFFVTFIGQSIRFVFDSIKNKSG